MKLSWHIREANVDDADQLKKCMYCAYSVYQARMQGKSLPPMQADYLSEIKNYPSWVVESEGRVLGGLIMMFDDNLATIANIALDPAYQGNGIGGALMKFAEVKAKEAGFTELQLVTHVLLDENLSLYQHLGWVETGRDETRVYMKKEL